MPRGTQDTASLVYAFHLRDYHPLWYAFPCVFGYTYTVVLMRSYNPEHTTKHTTPPPGLLHPAERLRARFVVRSVWALPPSLAATEGISVDFFSSGY